MEILLMLYLPVNVEIKKSFGRKSSFSEDSDLENSEGEEMKDDFFSKYVTSEQVNQVNFDNSSSFNISSNSASFGFGSINDFSSRSFRSRTHGAK